MAQTDIKQLFRKAFGYEPPDNFNIPQAPARLGSSSLGQPYYATDLYGREFFLPVKLNDYLLPFAVVSITPKKLIVETAMPERKGSVIELISIENYAINIKGILINDDNNFPEKELIELKDIFELNESVTLRSALTDIFLKGECEHKVVIKQMPLAGTAAIENARPFEMDLVTDMIFDLEID